MVNGEMKRDNFEKPSSKEPLTNFLNYKNLEYARTFNLGNYENDTPQANQKPKQRKLV